MKLDVEIYKLPARGWDAANFIPHYTRLVQGLLTNLSRKFRIGVDVESYRATGVYRAGTQLKIAHGLNNPQANLFLSGRVFCWSIIGQDANSLTCVAKMLTTRIDAVSAQFDRVTNSVVVEDATLFSAGDSIYIGSSTLRKITSVSGNTLFTDTTFSYQQVLPVYLAEETVSILVL